MMDIAPDMPVQYIKGVGSRRARLLNKLDIYTLADVIYHFPRDYEDRTEIMPISRWQSGQVVNIVCKIAGPPRRIKPRAGLIISKIPIQDGTSSAYAVWYNQKFIEDKFVPGKWYFMRGKVNIGYGEIQLLNPQWEELSSPDERGNEGLVPIYPSTADMSQKILRNIVKNALELVKGQWEEYLPTELRERYDLAEINFAINNIHFPVDVRSLNIARRRLAFDELFCMQLGFYSIKKKNDAQKVGAPFRIHDIGLEAFIRRLPFALTGAQQRVLDEILADMSNTRPMNRLVQGDVGCGKTILAVLALYVAASNGYQGAMMAPTEVLAQQHFQTLQKFFDGYDISVALLSGNMGENKKNEVLEAIKDGRIDVVVGTHAVIQDNVGFHRLGLVITDEQHRFGVRQRAVLEKKGGNPHVLVMSATPIPRSMALIFYGDLDVSIVDEMPPGRQQVETFFIPPSMRDRLYTFINQEISNGHQAYIICPLVEQSDAIDALSAQELYDQLKEKGIFGDSIGLIHGQMSANDKNEVMEAFKNGQISVLIGTTVIEVGVDVPNATVMVVENAERFGLAQLHQLRGRVGRGQHKSYCFLISNAGNSDAGRRLKIMTKLHDGFKIAEQDMQIRGPGQLLGLQQHGISELKLADIFSDIALLKQSKEAVQMLAEGIMILDQRGKLLLEQRIKRQFLNNIDEITFN
ncbi:MAG: ATP-dependent helicase RecG [Clostridiales bacterium]|nr:ATP-dependent helicase RecG [Clostridiales bacterium]